MGVLRDRLVLENGQARLGSTGSPVPEVVARLAGIRSPADLIVLGGPTAADVIAALTQTALGDDDSVGPTLIQTKPGNPAPAVVDGIRMGRGLSQRATARGRPLPPASSRYTTSGMPAMTPPSEPMTWESGSSRLTGTASLIAESRTPATPPTGFAGSANIKSSNHLRRKLVPCSISTAIRGSPPAWSPAELGIRPR